MPRLYIVPTSPALSGENSLCGLSLKTTDATSYCGKLVAMFSACFEYFCFVVLVFGSIVNSSKHKFNMCLGGPHTKHVNNNIKWCIYALGS